MGQVAFRGGVLDSALALGVSFPPLGDLAEFLVTAFLEGNPSRSRPALSPTVPPASAVSSLFDSSEVPCPWLLCGFCWGSGPWAAVQSGEVFLSLVGSCWSVLTSLSFSPRTQPLPCRWPEPWVLIGEDGPTMFYGTHFIMSPPAKSKLKRQGQLLSSVLSRTLSYKYRDLDAPYSGLGASDDPAELSTQLSAPGVLKVFGDSVCSGTHYKSVLATGTSSARELVREALERYALSPECASQFVLCDVVGQAGGGGNAWQAQGFRVFGDNEKPLLIQELWKPREGLSRRFELRKRSEVEELAAKDVDTMTAGEAVKVGVRGTQGGGVSGGDRRRVLSTRRAPAGANSCHLVVSWGREDLARAGGRCGTERPSASEAPGASWAGGCVLLEEGVSAAMHGGTCQGSGPGPEEARPGGGGSLP